MNIFDYLKWRGDLSFIVDPFNDVDNLVLSFLSYVDFQGILDNDKTMTIKELSDAYFKIHCHDDTKTTFSTTFNSPLVLKQMAETERFSDCKAYNYEYILHEETVEQFGAIMIDLPDGSTVISFRGTDDSIIGWKEDLMLSYGDIRSQFDALNYVNKNCRIFNKYRIIGHSKGGYLAIYTALNCYEPIRNNIIQIISNDGPGLRPESYSKENYEKIKDKYLLIVPEKDGVGTIYEMAENKKIVSCSSNNIISCHFITTWNVEGNKLVLASNHAYETDLTRKVILQFLKETDKKEREVFVEQLFIVLKQSNIESVVQFSKEGLPLVLNTIKNLLNLDDSAKKTGLKMVKALKDNLSKDLQKVISYRNHDLSAGIDSLINEYKNKLIKKKN